MGPINSGSCVLAIEVRTGKGSRIDSSHYLAARRRRSDWARAKMRKRIPSQASPTSCMTELGRRIKNTSTAEIQTVNGSEDFP